jgi:adenosylhomocysteine nucleosidase
MTKPLIVTLISANGEWRAVKDILSPDALQTSPVGEHFTAGGVTYFHGGWGKVSAAATAQYVIDRFHPDLLVNLGTCGGFAGRVERGAVLLVTRTIVYDILEQMGDADQAIADRSTDLDLGWLRQPYPHPVLPGLLVSADRDIVPADIPMLVEKYGAIAGDWESGAIAWVAQRNGVRCLILRGVTDLVGAAGGEAYGNIELFHENTRKIMGELIRQLPDWLSRSRP